MVNFLFGVNFLVQVWKDFGGTVSFFPQWCNSGA